MSSRIRVSDRNKLETIHSKNLCRIYEIYTLLRDLYYNYKRHGYNDEKISALLSNMIEGDFYRINTTFLKDALTNIMWIHKILMVENNADNLKTIILVAKEQIKYIQRMITILDDIVNNKKIASLQYEIKIFNSNK